MLFEWEGLVIIKGSVFLLLGTAGRWQTCPFHLFRFRWRVNVPTMTYVIYSFIRQHY
jgi:hypothetical protein